jgi:hypothetical protein
MPALVRSILAVAVGYAVIAALVMLGTVAAAALGATPDAAAAPGYMAASLVLGFLAAGMGGWSCAALAGARVREHTAALAALLVLVMLTMLAVGTPQPAWYLGLLALSGTAGVLGGGVLRERTRARAATAVA